MGELSINKKLNFVIPVEIKEGITYYIHSAPIMYETFESYFDVLGKAHSQIFAGGYGAITGPKISKLLVKRIAENMGVWNNSDGIIGVKDGLFTEINRLTNVVMPTEKGWTTIPFDQALKQNIFDSDDVREIENAITFFIVASAVHRSKLLRPMLELASGLWGAQLVSLNCTEYAASLATSTLDENTGEKKPATPSSIPF